MQLFLLKRDRSGIRKLMNCNLFYCELGVP